MWGTGETAPRILNIGTRSKLVTIIIIVINTGIKLGHIIPALLNYEVVSGLA
jgi:hypothetical protein